MATAHERITWKPAKREAAEVRVRRKVRGSGRPTRTPGLGLGLVVGLLALFSTLLVAAGTGSAQAATNWHGCPKYSVCLYRHANYVGDRGANVPDNKFSDCRVAHNIYQYGHHVSIVNHQVAQQGNDGRARYYTGYGTGVKYSTGPGYRAPNVDLYPIYSVRACTYT